MNKIFIRGVFYALALNLTGMTFGQDARSAEPLKQVSSESAVKIAEQFIRQNGYTNAPDSTIKSKLDHESIEWANSRAELLEARSNSLQASAIGIQATGDGWGVAFDYVDHPGNCRVVTMRKDGTQLRMQHQDGIRAFWVGSGEGKMP